MENIEAKACEIMLKYVLQKCVRIRDLDCGRTVPNRFHDLNRTILEKEVNGS